MKITRNITLQSAPEGVWPWLVEFAKLQQWNKGMVEERVLSQGAPGPGHVSEIAIKEGASINWYENEIMQFVPGEKLVVQLRGKNLGKNPMLVTYALTPEGDDTHLRYESTWAPHGFMLNLLYPIIVVVANQNATSCMKRLQKFINGS